MNSPAAVALALLCAFAGAAAAQSGPELVEAAFRGHPAPAHVYEEQTLVITDRQGKKTVRTLRFYALQDDTGSRSLRVIETPADAKGTRLYLERDSQGRDRQSPAATGSAFGSNFTVADLEPERPQDFRYERDADQVLGRVQHYVLRATPANEAVARRTGYQQRSIYLRKDNLFVSRIDYRDGAGRPIRRQTFRDPMPDDSGVWRPRMILMEDLRNTEQSLLKIERRIHSPDYVPAAVFAGLRTNP